MKNIFIVLAAAMLALPVIGLFDGCKGETGPQGPPGPAGPDAASLEGFAPGIKCGSCHDPDQDTTNFLWGKRYQWEQSKHAIGGDIERNGSGCAGCHTTEGFIRRMKGLTVTNQLTPSPPGCFACHSPHARGNFTLRNVDPVSLLSNIVGVPNAQFDYGKGNLCAKCHQPRPLSPLMDANAPGDSLVITSTRWYAHYGVQSQMLVGELGFEFPDFTYTGNSYHSGSTAIKQEGCPTCHMAEAVYPPNLGTGKAGGHTMNIHYTWDGVESQLLTGCKQSGCHPSMTSTDYPGSTTAPVGAQTATQRNLDTLLILLGQKGYMDTVASSPNYGLIKLTNGKLVVKPAIKAGAIFNYFLVVNDLSLGVHNTKYTIELLRSSIAEIRKP